MSGQIDQPPSSCFPDDVSVMRRALQIAARGRGRVEPNPMVGAVIVDQQRRWIAEGYHQRFGDHHAEIRAIESAGPRCRGADLFVTLEPCSHFGKTPPCADAVIQAGFRRVFVGCQDPAPHVAGEGIARLRAAGLEVIVGLAAPEADRLIAPFRMLQLNRRPWVHAKWAMTMDGRIATSTGHSRWISCDASRAVVHQMRGEMDAIITGAGTVRRDDPLLTARPVGARVPMRIVLDSDGMSLTADTLLCRTIAEAPVMIVVRQSADRQHLDSLRAVGVEVLVVPDANLLKSGDRVVLDPLYVLNELGTRGFTNVMLEGGAGLLGQFFDSRLIDELHVFVAPKLVGGSMSVPPIGGQGLSEVPEIPSLERFRWIESGKDLLLRGDVVRCSKSI